ncbi:SulP family inorganic anion transporter [Aureitalea marina]|uniref:Sodium-independent anion transporter n=1 Tax=Aureitalea marina TaxID=930804 RepID=A0A2S7KRT2_9FLAO|nr:SulP family inorganic anion transporter [Aureitalea marina]PQB05329.1 sodium-independent anion transporter [Aureitalea marina]
MFKGLFSNPRGDIFGGVTAGIVALPLALAFGVQSGLGPSAGLYGAIFIGFFASFFGGTNTQISGPTAPMTAVSMIVIAGIITANDGDVAKALPYILLVFLLSGLMQIALGMAGVGRYIKYIPYPVVSGFMTAIGVIILITQALPLLGYYTSDDTEYISEFKPEAEEVLLDKILKDEAGEGILVLEDFKETVERAEDITEDEIMTEAVTLAKNDSSGVIGAIRTLPRALARANWIEALLALLTIGIIYGFRRITTKIPSTLVALLVVSVGAYLLGVNYSPIEQIPSGFPSFQIEMFTGFRLSQVSPYVFTALTLAFLGAIDSLLTSVVADNMTKTRHRPNQELIGQGIGNSIAAVFGGIPGAGATIRTVVNIRAGASTRLSGMIAAVLLLSILLVLGPIASRIPAAVLAGILITVGIGVMDYKGLKAIPKMPLNEVVIMLTVLILSVFWNLVYAVGIGLVLASLIFMKKIGDLTAAQSKVVQLDISEEMSLPWNDEFNIPEELQGKVFIKRLNGPLFFGYTSDFQRLVSDISPEAQYVIIRMGQVPYMDQSGLYAMEEVLLLLNRLGVTTILEGLREQPKLMMSSIEMIPDLVAEEYLFSSFNEAMVFIRDRVEV